MSSEPKITVTQSTLGDHLQTFVSIDFPDWEDDGEDAPEYAGRVRPRNTWVVINGCPVHLQGLEVHEDDNGNQEVVNETWREEWDGLWQVYNPGDPFVTATINDKTYAIYATPHGD